MKCYCLKCGINWANLWSRNSDEEEEIIEFCPQCNTDEFLRESKQGPTYICCPFTGKITDIETGKELTRPLPVYIPTVKRRPAMTITEAEYERRCDTALAAYFKTGNQEDYFKAFKN